MTYFYMKKTYLNKRGKIFDEIHVYLRTCESPSSAIESLAVAISNACFKCSARCSGVINFVVSKKWANGLCATKKWYKIYTEYKIFDQKTNNQDEIFQDYLQLHE